MNTHFLIGKLCDAYDYVTHRYTHAENGVGFYQASRTSDMLYADTSKDPTQFYREIERATSIARLTPSKKCRINLGPTTALLIYHPLDIQDVWSTNVDNLEAKESINLFGHYFGQDVIMALGTKNPKYPPLRAAFKSAFLDDEGRQKLRPVIHQVAKHYVELYAKTGTIPLKELASRYSLDVILNGVLKAPNASPEAKDKLSHLIDTGINHAVEYQNVTQVALSAYNPFSTVKNAATEHNDAALKLIREKIITPHDQADQKTPLSQNPEGWLYQKMLRDQENLHNESLHDRTAPCHTRAIKQISDYLYSFWQKPETPSVTSVPALKETAFLITAGSETTTNFFTFTFLALMKNPDVLEKLIKEVDSVGKHPENMDAKDFAKMKYMNCVIMESFRFLPPLPVRKIAVAKDFKMRDNTEVKAGDHIYVNIRATHRVEDYYPDPEKFKPERFQDMDLNQVLEKGYTAAWQPFGRLRVCPGRKVAVDEMRLALAYFIYHFNMKLVNKEWDFTMTKTTFGMTAVSPDEKPLGVEVTRRDHKR